MNAQRDLKFLAPWQRSWLPTAIAAATVLTFSDHDITVFLSVPQMPSFTFKSLKRTEVGTYTASWVRRETLELRGSGSLRAEACQNCSLF